MPLMTQSAFARLCGDEKQAVHLAIDRHKLRAVGPRRMIDTDDDLARAYLLHPSGKRRSEQRKKRMKTAHKGASMQQRKRPAVDLCKAIEKWWSEGGLPDGWSALCLEDIADPDTPKMNMPLIFYSPTGEEGEKLYHTEAAGTYTIDLSHSCATDSAGKKHPIALHTFGRCPWVEKAKAAAKKQRPSIHRAGAAR